MEPTTFLNDMLEFKFYVILRPTIAVTDATAIVIVGLAIAMAIAMAIATVRTLVAVINGVAAVVSHEQEKQTFKPTTSLCNSIQRGSKSPCLGLSK